MASSSLAILVDEKRVSDLLKQKTGAKALLKSACNLCCFLTFLVIFTSLALFEQLSLFRSFEAYVRHRFDHGAAMRLEEVNSINDFYDYWNRSMIPGIFSNDTNQYTFPGSVMQTMLKVDGDKANNRLFGVVRIRQVKAANMQECKLQEAYVLDFRTCSSKFSIENELTSEFGPSTVLGGPKFSYAADEQSKEWTGWLATYSAGGYLQKMHVNYTGAVDLMTSLKRDNWCDLNTRAIFFEWTLYNFNLGLFAVCRISFEVSVVGGWLKTFDIDIVNLRYLKPLGDGGGGAWAYLIMEVVLLMFVFFYMIEEVSEFVAFDRGHSSNPCMRLRIKTDYFYDGWNIIDWSNLILIIIVFGFRISNWGIGGDKIEGLSSIIGTNVPVSEYRNFHDVVHNIQIMRNLTAFNAVLTWFKAVKYINILPYISTFMETMAIAWEMLAGWAAVFALSFIGFCLSYSTAFGESISDFRTIPRAFVYLMRAFTGNADMRLVYNANPVIGSLLIILFVVGMIFINLNLFYAILISSLSQARQTQEVNQAKAWAKLMDKFEGFGETVTRVLQLKSRFRQCFPGLYSRMKTWEKHAMQLEKKREERILEKERAQMPHADIEASLGAANPNCARRAKRQFKQNLDDDDEEKSDAESEPDLGNLFFKEQLNPHKFHHAGGDDNMLMDNMPDNEGRPGFGNVDPIAMEQEAEDHAKAKVLEATEYVCGTVVDRCRGARSLVLSEMTEARQVFQGISSVLQVLGARARSLEAQQEMVLPAEVLARVKEAAGDTY